MPIVFLMSVFSRFVVYFLEGHTHVLGLGGAPRDHAGILGGLEALKFFREHGLWEDEGKVGLPGRVPGGQGAQAGH